MAEPRPAGVGLPHARRDGPRLLSQLNADYAARAAIDPSLAARLGAHELAGRMQASIPAALSFAAETKALCGIDDPVVGPTARNFLLARRLVERGVRFVQVYNGGALGSSNGLPDPPAHRAGVTVADYLVPNLFGLALAATTATAGEPEGVEENGWLLARGGRAVNCLDPLPAN